MYRVAMPLPACPFGESSGSIRSFGGSPVSGILSWPSHLFLMMSIMGPPLIPRAKREFSPPRAQCGKQKK
jgi:hypothetical protein